MNRDRRIRLPYLDRECSRPLFYPGDAHGLLCAPTRTGKFRDVICQILLSWLFSCFCLDTKGQAGAVTARFRRECLGQEVYRLDPFDVVPSLPGVRWAPPLAKYNVLSSIDPSSDTFVGDIDRVVETSVPHTTQSDTHWVDTARGIGGGATMYQRKWFPKEPLPTVYHTVCNRRDLALIAEDAQIRAETGDHLDRIIADRLNRCCIDDGVSNKEISSVLSALETGLQFTSNPAIARSLSETTIEFSEMKRRPVTIILTQPGESLADANLSKWFRLVTGCAVSSWLRDTSRAVPVLGVLDEFKATVGKLPIVETMMGLGAGYGIQLLNVFQDLSQIKALWPEGGWETFLANSGFKIFFTPQDKTTSDYISDMCGVTEIRTVAKSLGEQKDGELSVNLSFAQHARKYLLPHEARYNIGKDEALIFGEGLPGVVRAFRRPYYLIPEFQGAYDIDPYHYRESAGEKGKVSGGR